MGVCFTLCHTPQQYLLHHNLATKCLETTEIQKETIPATTHLLQHQLKVLLESNLL